MLRYANVYGPRQDPHGEAGVVAIFMNRLIAGEPIQINARREAGDRGCVRDYVYISDVARANIAAMKGEIDQTVINICSGADTDTQLLADEIQKSLGTSVEVTFGPLRPGDVERSVLDPTDITAAQGTPTDLHTGLTESATWFRAKADKSA